MKKIIIFSLLLIFLTTSTWWEQMEEGVKYDLSGKRILVLIGEDYDWLELDIVKKILENWGAKVFISSYLEETKGHVWDLDKKKGWYIKEYKNVKADILLDKVDSYGFNSILSSIKLVQNSFSSKKINIDNFDVILIPGGKSPFNLLKYSKYQVLSLLNEASNKKIILSAICHGPLLLAEARLVKDKKVVAHPQLKDQMIRNGASYVSEKAVSDGIIVTGNWPYFASFCKVLASTIVAGTK